MGTILKPGDIFLTKGKGFVSRAIRFFTRGIGESRTQVNHVGLVVKEGDLKTAVVVEALIKVKRHPLWSQYGPPKEDGVAIYRSVNLTDEEIDTIVKEAEQQVGKDYGFLKIAMHFLDWMFFGIYFFRRLVPNSRYPICSWLVAHSYSKAGKDFGVVPGAAEPDDIWDFIKEKRPQYFQEIHPLESLSN
jgi:hypothetical protein